MLGHVMIPRKTLLSIVVLYATSTFPIMHLINPPTPPPPQILHKHCFKLLLGRLQYPGEMKNKGCAKFGGTNRCIVGNMEVTCRTFSHDVTAAMLVLVIE